MDLSQLWFSTVNEVCKNSEIDMEKALFQSLSYQCGLQLIDNNLFVICKNEIIKKNIESFGQKIIDELAKTLNVDKDFIEVISSASFFQRFSRKTPTSADNHSPYENMTFETFKVSNKNKETVSIAKAISDNYGEKSNKPLYVYGASGVGKTHLLWSIANRIKELKPQSTIIYLRAEQFIRNYVLSLTANKEEGIFFNKSFTKDDVLIIDDLHLLGNGEKTQKAFYGMIQNVFSQSQLQILLSATEEPSKLITEDLICVFLQSIQYVKLFPADVQTKKQIIIEKCKEADLTLSSEIVVYLARNFKSDIRHIEGFIKTLKAITIHESKELSLRDVKSEFSKLVSYHLV